LREQKKNGMIKEPSAIYNDRKAMEKLKNNKLPGPDNIIAEQCKQNR